MTELNISARDEIKRLRAALRQYKHEEDSSSEDHCDALVRNNLRILHPDQRSAIPFPFYLAYHHRPCSRADCS